VALGAHKRLPNGILGLLYREHFPGLVLLASTIEPAYMFEHYVTSPDAEDECGKVYGSKAERVMMEFWVSLPPTTLLNTSPSSDFLEIMN
jgi:hypothetical protein